MPKKAKKDKKDKKPPNLQPEFHLSKQQKEELAKGKTRKKNPPDKPQPAWLFPPEDKNPVLNPVVKSEEQKFKEKEEHDATIDFLHHKVVNAPMRPAPPGELLTLVGAFLSNYGFDGASRLYTTQLKARKRLGDWDIEIGKQLPKGFPNLVRVFKDWHKDYELKTEPDETSSSDSDDSQATKKRKRKLKAAKASKAAADAAQMDEDETSSSEESGSDGSNDNTSDIKMEDPPAQVGLQKKTKRERKRKSISSSSSTSSSESGTDEQKEATGVPLSSENARTGPFTNGLATAAIEKDSSSSSSSVSDSDSDTSSDSEAAADAGRDAVETPSVMKKAANDSSSSSNTSSDSNSDSDSESDASPGLGLSQKPASTLLTATTTAIEQQPKTSSDSSETLQASSAQKKSTDNTSLSSSDSESDSDSEESKESLKPTEEITTVVTKSKRKRSESPPAGKKSAKKTNPPFQRVPADVKIDAKFSSNAYQPYHYADRAHQDLSVTRGKDFTKEKNKKKRGSYRGGMIDVHGGKGIRFED